MSPARATCRNWCSTRFHFFAHYKDLEPGKFVKINGWVGIEEAKKEILDGIKAFEAAKEKPAY